MKRTDLMKRLRNIAKDKGHTAIVKEGGPHTKVTIGDVKVTVPRHNEINEHTANGILEDAEQATPKEDNDK